MADESRKEPVFEVTEDSVTHLHGTEVPNGVVTFGPSVSNAKPPSPDQAALVVNGAYQFAKLLNDA